MSRILGAALALALGGASLVLGGGHVREAQAIIGRPLTPLSYAGVARRTVRRGAYYGAYGAYGAAAYGAAAGAAAVGAAATAAAIATLPAGCVKTYVNGEPVFTCGAAAYRPVYDGPNLVYVPMAVP